MKPNPQTQLLCVSSQIIRHTVNDSSHFQQTFTSKTAHDRSMVGLCIWDTWWRKRRGKWQCVSKTMWSAGITIPGVRRQHIKRNMSCEKRNNQGPHTCYGQVTISNRLNLKHLTTFCNSIKCTVNVLQKLEYFNRATGGTPPCKSINVGWNMALKQKAETVRACYFIYIYI